jgi:hypothetical protein
MNQDIFGFQIIFVAITVHHPGNDINRDSRVPQGTTSGNFYDLERRVWWCGFFRESRSPSFIVIEDPEVVEVYAWRYLEGVGFDQVDHSDQGFPPWGGCGHKISPEETIECVQVFPDGKGVIDGFPFRGRED